MSGKLKILFVTAEAIPFAKVGGLGDVASALPKALWSHGADCRLILPLYGCIDKNLYRLRRVVGSPEIQVPIGNQFYHVRFFRSNIPDSRVQVFFVDCPPLFGDRQGIYADPQTQIPYSDNPIRFILFSKSVLEFLKIGVFRPDVIHLNDNQTALVAPMLKTQRHEAPHAWLSYLPSLLTIHNLQYQGLTPPETIHLTELPADLAHWGGPFEFYGQFNFLKAGISFANKLNTVSPTYAYETAHDPAQGFGLDGLLRHREQDYSGILNGADYETWNPEIDTKIPMRFRANRLKGKAVCREKLLEIAGFNEPKSDWPVIGMISRLASQKGFDLLLAALDEIVNYGAYLIILGTGEPKIQERLVEAMQRHPDHIALFLTFNDTLAHQIEAGADLFLMPSLFEPCGLNQIYSLRYGTIPIVHKTGGLADTVKDYTETERDGWGFAFSPFSSHELLKSVGRAIQTWRDKKTWTTLVKRAMALQFGWEESAQRYKSIYQELTHGR